MRELTQSLKILSLAGALLLAVPTVGSAAPVMPGGGGHAGGGGHFGGGGFSHGGGSFGRSGGGFARSGGGSGHFAGNMGHRGFHRGRFRGGDLSLWGYDDYPDYYAYDDSCGYYNVKWHQTGSRVWLRRYESCLHG